MNCGRKSTAAFLLTVTRNQHQKITCNYSQRYAQYSPDLRQKEYSK